MRILLVLPRPLFPADTGGKIRTLNIFSRLAKQCEIHAVSLAAAEKDAKAIEKMKALFPVYRPVPWKETLSFSAGFYAKFLLSRFRRFPYFLEKYRVPAFRSAIAEMAAHAHYDVVLCDFLQSAVVALDLPLDRRVIFEHNVEYVIRRRHWEQETNFLRKSLLDAEWKKARAIEAEVCRSFAHVITVSEEDRRMIEREFGVTHVSDLPTGVDLDYFAPREVERKPGKLVFVGSMDWHPNEDGIFWFVREVFPRIRERVPEANLTVVGRNPSARLRALAGAGTAVEITGTVEDVRPYLARAEAAIVPLRIGGGTRIKIFEAMSMARAVISTTLGAEGLPLSNEREILLRDSPEEFASGVIELLRDPARRESLERAGRAKVVRDHGWDRVAVSMGEMLERVAHKTAVTSGVHPTVPAAAGAARER